MASFAARFFHRSNHAISLGEVGGEGFFDQDVHFIRRDLFHPIGMRPAGGAENHDIGFGLLDALFPIGEDAIIRNGAIANRILHLFRIFVADTYDLCIARGVSVAQQVIHVSKIKIDSGDPPFFTSRHLGGSEKKEG